ncbi:uncharacterized protein STAUR_6008 [Stigmatella aurantiaca DW4/3-1]|uniref:Uncharacterized protein n=1 Tax=Stigmatella aurantiaca (strain DW4/3-1) TaxID=378806 RepID=E3G0K3_STIAD|nr:uncharacterized protein STAUR_6008 [Stigmatella aurantiaca DW4/3-1]
MRKVKHAFLNTSWRLNDKQIMRIPSSSGFEACNSFRYTRRPACNHSCNNAAGRERETYPGMSIELRGAPSGELLSGPRPGPCNRNPAANVHSSRGGTMNRTRMKQSSKRWWKSLAELAFFAVILRASGLHAGRGAPRIPSRRAPPTPPRSRPGACPGGWGGASPALPGPRRSPGQLIGQPGLGLRSSREPARPRGGHPLQPT